MFLLEKLRLRVRALVDREALDADLDEELRYHVERQIEQFVEQGMDPARARTEALRLFGGVEKVKEECRDERRVNFVDHVAQDVGHALRSFGQAKGFALLTAVTLALGIGANTAIFSVVHGVLLAPLPYPEPDELVMIDAREPIRTSGRVSFSILEFFELRDEVDEIDLVEYHGMSFTLLGNGYASNVLTGVVSHDFFDVLGVTPQHGRFFVAADERPDAEAVLVLSDRYWREQFGADPTVVGRVFEMNDRPHRVIGVLPDMPQYPRDNDVYMPSTACPLRGRWAPVDAATPRNAFSNLLVFGRLADGVDAATGDHAVAAAAEAVVHEHADHYADTGRKVSAAPLHDVLTEDARPMLLLLLGTVALVLLVACANAANLMVARVLRRDRELALRAAMGASRGRLARQLLTESTLLSLAGGALGLILAAAGLGALVDFTARFTPRVQDIGIDGTVLFFTVAVSAATGILAGVLPGLWARADVAGVLRDGAGPQATANRATLRARSVLIAAQVALSFVLLIGAGLTINTFVKLSTLDAGFVAEDRVFAAQVSPNWSEYDDADKEAALYAELIAVMRDGPGVVSVAVANTLPMAHGMTMTGLFRADGSPLPDDPGPGIVDGERVVELSFIGISADYFDTVGIPIVAGRGLTRSEIETGAPVALVSESAAGRYWPGESPIGRRVAIPDPAEPEGSERVVWHSIVGVTGDARHFGLQLRVPEVLFASYRFGGAGGLLVRTSADAATMGAYIKEAVARVAPLQAVAGIRTLESIRSSTIAAPRLTATLMSLFALLATVVTVAGIGGVVAFAVGQRTHEIGIRMALGAQRRAVLGLVIAQGLSMVAVGLALGALGALWFSSLLGSLLYDTEPTDPFTFLGVGVLLLLATGVACWLPARRATAIDPVVALRAE